MSADKNTWPLRSELAAFLRHALTDDELLDMFDYLPEPWRLSIAEEVADNLRPGAGWAGPPPF